MKSIVLAVVLALAAGLPGLVQAASAESEKEKRIAEQYRRCLEGCKKPVPRQGSEEEVWARNTRDEARYDNCEQNCDRKLLRGFRK